MCTKYDKGTQLRFAWNWVIQWKDHIKELLENDVYDSSWNEVCIGDVKASRGWN